MGQARRSTHLFDGSSSVKLEWKFFYKVYDDKEKIFNDDIYNKPVAALDDSEMSMNEESRLELDCYANMAVIGKHVNILPETGKMLEFNPFTAAYKPITAPIVDAVLQFGSPYDGKSYILVVRNTLQ